MQNLFYCSKPKLKKKKKKLNQQFIKKYDKLTKGGCGGERKGSKFNEEGNQSNLYINNSKKY